MKAVRCESCGANEWKDENGYRVCLYCGTKFVLSKEDKASKQSSISLNSDVDRLLEKCKKEPINARKYANIILEIDPMNKEAQAIAKRGY